MTNFILNEFRRKDLGYKFYLPEIAYRVYLQDPIWLLGNRWGERIDFENYNGTKKGEKNNYAGLFKNSLKKVILK